MGIIAEEDSASPPSFHNAYEQSKWQAEQSVREAAGIQATIYRPAIIVGDSATGHTTTFNGLYRFLELGARLASGKKQVRLPMTGNELWNLVPVDWVSRGITELLDRPKWHGRTFHLVSRSPISARLIGEAGAEVLDLAVPDFVGTKGDKYQSRFEQLFLQGIRDYWPYLSGSPVFDFSNTRTALPHLPAPTVDRSLLKRLIRFAADNHWGRQGSSRTACSSAIPFSCATYIEEIFPTRARRSNLAREVGLNLAISLEVRGPGGGLWSCRWQQGDLAYVRRGLEPHAAVTYQLDTATLQAVLIGQLSPQQAFFEERISISGDVETGLKLAVLFERFLREQSPKGQRMEAMDGVFSQG
jgi:hypothetical protein